MGFAAGAIMLAFLALGTVSPLATAVASEGTAAGTATTSTTPLPVSPAPAPDASATEPPAADPPASPSPVKIGLYITQLYDLDIAKKSFNVAFWAWFLHADTKYKPVETIEIVNSKQSTTRYPSSAPSVAGQWTQAKYYATMAKDWDIRNYPFDRQVLEIYLEDGQSDANTQALSADEENSRIDAAIHVPGWTIESFAVKSVNAVYDTTFGDPGLKGQSTYSRVVAAITMKRNGIRLLTSVFIGFFVAFFMSCLTYFLDFKHMAGARISLCAGGIFASAGNKFAVDNILTPGGDFTLADGIEISTFCAILVAIATVVALRPLAENHPITTRVLNAMIGVTAIGGYLAFNGYVVYMAAM